MASQRARSPVLVILGPTASGKTAVSVEIARRVDGEVISADSRAFFVGLDIVTAKPTLQEQLGIPHHLIDSVPLTGSYDAMAFRKDVERLLPEIATRQRVAIIAGGGTLYLGAILRGLFEGPDNDETFREGLNQHASEDLFERLSAVDPAAAMRIHPNDRLRITRALEVHHTTGKPMSSWQMTSKPLPEDFRVFGLCRDRAQHRQAIEQRIRAMLAHGLMDEIARLRNDGLAEGMQAYRTIGVPEAFDHLDGNITRDDYISMVTARTWQLVRRQMAWFRRDENVCWIDVTARTPEDIAAQIHREFVRPLREAAP